MYRNGPGVQLHEHTDGHREAKLQASMLWHTPYSTALHLQLACICQPHEKLPWVSTRCTLFCSLVPVPSGRARLLAYTAAIAGVGM